MAYNVDTYTLHSTKEVLAVVTHGFRTEIVEGASLLPVLSISHRVHYVLDVKVNGNILSFLKGGDPSGQRYGVTIEV